MGRGLRPRVWPGPARLTLGSPSPNRLGGESINRTRIAQAARIRGQRGAKAPRLQSLQVLKEPLRPSPRAGPKALGRLCDCGFAAAFERRGNLALAEPRRLSCESWRGMERKIARGCWMLSCREGRKRPLLIAVSSSAGGGRGLAQPTPGAGRATRRRNYPNIFDILLQEFWVRAEPHENIMRSIDNPIKRSKTRSALRRQIAKLGINGRVLTNWRRNNPIIMHF